MPRLAPLRDVNGTPALMALALILLGLSILACSRAERLASRVFDELALPTETPIPATALPPTSAPLTPTVSPTPALPRVPRSGDCLMISQESFPGFGGDLRLIRTRPMAADGRLKFTIEPGDGSALLMARAADAEDIVVVQSITGPDGALLYALKDYDAGTFTGELFPYVLEGIGELDLFLPVGPDFPLRPGTYELSLLTLDGSAICDAAAVIRSGRFRGAQSIDLDVWVVSTADVFRSSGARTDFESQARAAVDEILRPHGLRLGQVRFFESSDEQKAAFSSSDENAYNWLCEAMAGVAGVGRAWRMVLLDELLTAPEEEDEASESFYGLSPMPGGVLAPGSLNSCFLVAWELHDGDFRELGATIVHEGSHFLGLEHTTEDDGLTFDRLADTPECPLDIFDEDQSGDVDDLECGAEGGADNFLFWNSSGDPQRTYWMSEDQAWVLRRHPLFHTIGDW